MARRFCLFLCLFILQKYVAVGGNQTENFPAINSSAEFKLRRKLFAEYDRMVRPVVNSSHVVLVTFELELKKLVGVNNKDQVINTDTLVTQKWNNPFLRWNPVDYEGIQRLLVRPQDVWVPDIVLENNGDSGNDQAGHLEKFRSWVLIEHGGENKWFSPATFLSTCDLDVRFFPFDRQECRMVFRSLTADSSFMAIETTRIDSDDPEKDLKFTSSNGYWSIRLLKTHRGEYIRGPRRFQEVILSFEIGRKPIHFVLFSMVPCMIIGMLILVSFFIPAESGERIGLCATILLAVSVYLLVVTEQLPEQSDTLPLIGVYYIVIMFEIGLALAATVLVLMAHHGTSKPPSILKCLTALNNIGCCRGKKASKLRVSSPISKVGVEDSTTHERKESSELENIERGIEEVPPSKRRSTAITILTVDEEEKNQETWKEIGRALDRIFFWTFLSMFVVSSAVIYAQAGRLSVDD